MRLPSCSHLRIVVGLWCGCLAASGIAMPMAGRARAPTATEVNSEAGSTDAAAEFAEGASTDRTFDPRRRPPVARATLIGAHSDDLVSPTDRDRLTPAESEAVAFAQPIDAIDDLAFDQPRTRAWFSDDEALMARMRGVRDRVSALLDWSLSDKINQAGRELLETLGIDDTATTRLMSARPPAEQSPSRWAARAADPSSPGDTPWNGESGRNALAKFLFLIWDTLTHPLFLALVFLFVGARAMLALVRMSARGKGRRRTASRSVVSTAHTPRATPPAHWTRRRRVR